MTSTSGGPWFYPNLVSARPGESVALHASSAHGPCTLTVTRIDSGETEVARFDEIVVDEHSIPEHADENGCGWPEVFSFAIGNDWVSGYYDLELHDAEGSSTHHFVCVRPAADAVQASILMVLSTNTYQSYNYWGGCNSYADVDAIMGGKADATSRATGIGRLSRMRPYAQNLIATPAAAPRMINSSLRGPGELGFPGDPEWMAANPLSGYDGSACFVGKWEHRFAEWAASEGFALDYATDHDFNDDPEVLRGYDAVVLVGHSEYWSAPQRDQLDRYVAEGGNLAVLSGNTGYWKVRWEDNGETLIAYKWDGETSDPLWADPATRQDATHLWSHPEFGRPEAEVTGLSFLYGGYHRLVMCVARGSAAFTVYDDQHWALDAVDLYYGDTFGSEVPLVGYENDGCPLRFDERGLPAPDGGLGVPQNLNIIAIAPATLFEPDSPFPKAIPPENPEALAAFAYGMSGEGSVERVSRGHAVVATFTKGKGEVFNSGTTEWAHGLAANDPYVSGITRNVLTRFIND